MNIKRIKYSVVLIVMFFSFVNLVHASFEITEIMYDPTQNENYNEWIEIHNTGTSLNLTDLLVCGSTIAAGYIDHSDGKLNQNNGLILESGKFAIITDGASGTEVYTNYSVSDTALALHISGSEMCSNGLSNTGETIQISGLSSNPDPVSYQSSDGANGDGNSLQLINGEWEPAIPTPGEENVPNTDSNPSVDIDNTNDTTTTTSSTSTSNTPKEIPVVYKITTKIVAPKIVTAGVPFVIDHNTTGINKEKVILGKFIWNFGDGMSKSGATSDAFNYVYDYPGDYVITLSYGDSTFDIKPDATDRLTIKVIPSGINISSVGTYSDPFVELENKSSYEMSISGWILRGSVHAFMIPEGTVILSNKKLKLSPKITGFDFNDLSSISIIDTSGQVFASFPNYVKPVVKYSANKNSVGNIVKSDIVESSQAQNIGNTPEVINLNDLGASAGSVDNGFNNKTLIYFGLALIIIIGIISVILIRRKNEIPDYVEGGVSAKDMTIME